MSALLCDIGGTHIRFAVSNEGGLDNIHKARVDAYENLDSAISQYLTSCQTVPATFYLATAAIFDGEKWVFTNHNKWHLHPAALREKFSFHDIVCLNDFEANALGVVTAEPSDLVAIVSSEKKSIPRESRCVVGIGSGLGFSYLVGDLANPVVQQTYGGHMLPTIRSEEHFALFKFAAARRNTGTIEIYEDVLSGEGLYNVYLFLCAQNHFDADYRDSADLMARGKDDEIFRQALDIFFEILGLFVHQLVAFGHSYGGLYLTGGVIDRLMLSGLFAKDKFLENFYQNTVAIVKNNVLSTPVYWIKDEFVSLKGLSRLARKAGHA